MHYHSPAAYRYLRDKFHKTLPCVSTFCKWFSESDLKCSPGILPEAISALKGIVTEFELKNQKVFVSLSFDEVSVRRHVQWIHESKKWSGFITYGSLNDKKKLPIANNVLVFMATVLDFGVSIPIAYYAINSLNAEEKEVLLRKILAELFQIGIKVANITFDGLASNLSLCSRLGCSLDIDNPKTYFVNSFDSSKIFIIFDPCHMIKLIRNSLGDLDYIQDPQLGRVKWAHFVSLEKFRVNNKFMTHRLTKRHIQYYRNKMNVRLAMQTFSNATGTSMEYLKQIGIPAFRDSTATINFVKKLNTISDIMNTKRINNDQIFKSALNPNNANEIFEFFDEMVVYLKSLKFKKKYCIMSRRKTGFLGLYLNMFSIKQMYFELVTSKCLQSLAIFFHSQDPLESFFSRIRALNGANDNPTQQQFQSAIRKLLFYNEINSSLFANCTDNLNILTISSVKKRSSCMPTQNIDVMTESNHSDEDERDNEINEHVDGENVANDVVHEIMRLKNTNGVDFQVETLEDASIAFLAGAIEIKIQESPFTCTSIVCINIFKDNEKIDGDFINNNTTQRPCSSTFMICKYTHLFFDKYKEDPDFNYRFILSQIKKSLSTEILFEYSDFSHCPTHFIDFIETIIDEYVRLYGTYIAKCLTLEQYQIMLRARNRRVTIFGGQ